MKEECKYISTDFCRTIELVRKLCDHALDIAPDTSRSQRTLVIDILGAAEMLVRASRTEATETMRP